MQVLAHDDGQGATGVGEPEERGAQGAQGIGPGGGQQEHHGVALKPGQFVGALVREFVGVDGEEVEVRVELTLFFGALEGVGIPERVVPFEAATVLPPGFRVLDGRQPSREGEVAGTVADEDQIAGRIVCCPFVEVRLVAVAESEQAGGGQRPTGQVMAHDRDLRPPDGPRRPCCGGCIRIGHTRSGRGWPRPAGRPRGVPPRRVPPAGGRQGFRPPAVR